MELREPSLYASRSALSFLWSRPIASEFRASTARSRASGFLLFPRRRASFFRDEEIQSDHQAEREERKGRGGGRGGLGSKASREGWWSAPTALCLVKRLGGRSNTPAHSAHSESASQIERRLGRKTESTDEKNPTNTEVELTPLPPTLVIGTGCLERPRNPCSGRDLVCVAINSCSRKLGCSCREVQYLHNYIRTINVTLVVFRDFFGTIKANLTQASEEF